MSAEISVRPIPQIRGQLVADFLAGSWRNEQAPVEIRYPEFEALTALLYNSGAVGLGWWRIRESDLRTTSHGELLHQGYRLQALQSAINEQRITTAFRILRDAGIEPILIKGWSIARLYPHPTLRAYGDIDLLVRPAEFRTARELLNQEGAWWVDLHSELSELADRLISELFARSRNLDVNETKVRVLCPEDNLALLAIHLFKHGAWRPSWLCDIGALIESLPAEFDWNLSVGSNKRRASWITSAILLAHELLGANIDEVPVKVGHTRVPEWLTDAVLKQWSTLWHRDHLPIQPRPLMANSLRRAKTLLREVRERWPDPIVATFNLEGRVNNLPRLPYQLVAFIGQAPRFVFSNFH
jgi:hypothetical protein